MHTSSITEVMSQEIGTLENRVASGSERWLSCGVGIYMIAFDLILELLCIDWLDFSRIGNFNLFMVKSKHYLALLWCVV